MEQIKAGCPNPLGGRARHVCEPCAAMALPVVRGTSQMELSLVPHDQLWAAVKNIRGEQWKSSRGRLLEEEKED